jgi:gliding motility-associated-like protein
VLNLLGGQQIEPVGHFEYFGADGLLKDEALGEYNKHGNDSWAYQQRGIDYITRDEFGYNADIQHRIFRGSNRQNYQRLILKAAANDNYPFANGAHIRDSYLQSLSQVAGQEMDERSHESIIMYANGQYWGVYDIREKVDDHDYTEFYYNQGRWDIDFLKTWGGTWAEYGSNADWNVFRNFVLNNDMTDPANYAIVEEQYETLSLIDYFVLNSYAVCSDWLNWNTGWWKGNNPQGQAKKWRYILWDLDASFGHYINYTGIPDQSANANICFPEFLGNPGGQGHVPIWNKLLTNEQFFAKYINRMSDLSNTYYSCEHLQHHLDSLIGIIEPEMQRQINRWGGTMAGWQQNVQEVRDFIQARCTYINTNILGCYDELDGPYQLTVQVQPAPGGRVQVNTIVPNSFPFSGTYFGGIQQTLTAIPNIGYTFSHWSTNVPGMIANPNSPEIQFSLTADVTFTAHFVPLINHQVTFIVEPTGAGRINVAGQMLTQFPNVVSLPAMVGNTIFALENPGYKFEKWEVAMPNVMTEGNLLINNNLLVNFPGVVKAIFSEKLYDISFDVQPAGIGTIDINGETIQEYPDFRQIWGDQITTLTAKTNRPFWVLDRWIMDHHVPDPSFVDADVEVEFANHDDVVARFVEIPNYEITFVTVPKDKGMIRFGDRIIDQFPHTERFAGGESHMLEAVEPFKFKFQKWDFRMRPTLTGTSPIMQYTVTRKDTIVLHLEERFSDVFIPNSFTPNGDSVNEIWKVIGTEVMQEGFSLVVYDRWGDLVFSTTDINQGWNGAKMNSEYYCPTGVYAYNLKYRNAITNQAQEVAGSITLIR